MCLIYGAVSILGLLPNVKDDESCQHKYAAKKKKKKMNEIFLLLALYWICSWNGRIVGLTQLSPMTLFAIFLK